MIYGTGRVVWCVIFVVVTHFPNLRLQLILMIAEENACYKNRNL